MAWPVLGWCRGGTYRDDGPGFVSQRFPAWDDPQHAGPVGGGATELAVPVAGRRPAACSSALAASGDGVPEEPSHAIYFGISDRHGGKGLALILLRPGVSVRRPIYDVGHDFPPAFYRARPGASPS